MLTSHDFFFRSMQEIINRVYPMTVELVFVGSEIYVLHLYMNCTNCAQQD